MIKAKLIENNRYYKLVKYPIILLLLVCVPYSVILENLGIPEKWSLVAVIILMPVIGGFIYFLFIRPFNRAISHKTMEIKKDLIRITGSNEQDITEWDVNEVDTIVTSQNYYLPNDERIPWLDKVTRAPHHNFLEIKKGGEQSRYEFHLDSHYMAVQIKKAVDNWVAKGLPVKRI